MLTAPKQNWEWYEKKCHGEHVEWLRKLTAIEALELHSAIHSIGFTPQNQGWALVEELHWEEKVAIRKKICAALAEMDRIRRERCHSKNLG